MFLLLRGWNPEKHRIKWGKDRHTPRYYFGLLTHLNRPGAEEGVGSPRAKLSKDPKDYLYGAHGLGGSFSLSRVRERCIPWKAGLELEKQAFHCPACLGSGKELMPDSVTTWLLVRMGDHQAEDELKILLTFCINFCHSLIQSSKEPSARVGSRANEWCHQSHCNFPYYCLQ